jgi:hypothetical protein
MSTPLPNLPTERGAYWVLWQPRDKPQEWALASLDDGGWFFLGDERPFLALQVRRFIDLGDIVRIVGPFHPPEEAKP